MVSKKYLSWFFVVTVLAVTACSKKKDAAFPDGQGLDLLKITDYENRTETMNTKEALADVTFNSTEFVDNQDKNKIKVVKYNVQESSLLPSDIIVRGVPNNSYKVIYKLTEKELIIYKNADLSKFAQEELQMADTEKDGSISIPLVKYAVTGFYTIVAAKREDGETTSKLRENSVNSKAAATHFKIDRIANVYNTIDINRLLIKSNFFQGVWYTSTVVSKIAESKAGLLGMQASYDSKWESADKIEFIKTKDKILGLNANYDKRIKITDDGDKLNNLTSVISFPVDYVDTAWSENRSKNYYDANGQEKNWKDRQWAAVDFARISTSLVQNLPADPIVSGLKITDEFLMYSLQFKGLKITMSFLRESAIQKLSTQKYQPKNYFLDDFKYFGIFATEKKSLNTFEKYRKEDYELNRFMNRFHPEQYKTQSGESRQRIRFLFTENSVTDENLIETVRQSIKAWDFAFKQSGLNDVDIVLDESQRVALGDIRYNTVNLVRTLTSTSLLGYGPSIADPDSGQIVSATTNLHVTSIRDSLISVLRNYLRHKRGELAPNYPLGQNTKSGLQIATPNVKIDNAAKFALANKVCDFSATGGNIINEVESTPACKGLVDLSQNKTNQNENELLSQCAEALLPSKVQATMIHELGHNFGLRHNFFGSIDKINFPRKMTEQQLQVTKNYSCPEGKASLPILARSSSVMEYTDMNEDRLTFVGPYDVEAIRYSYADQIMDDKCQVHKLDNRISIDKNLQKINVKKMPLSFCSDEHIEVGMNPLCQRHDSGENATEVAKDIINRYNVLYATQNFRYDRAKVFAPEDLASYKKGVIFEKLKGIYEQWRLYVTEFVGENNKNLEVYDINSYKQVTEKMFSDAKYGRIYKDYYDASRIIFNFLMDITFMPDRFCLVQTPNSEYELMELTVLIKEIEKTMGVAEVSCKDKNIAEFIKKKGTLIRETGFYYENQKASEDANSSLFDVLQSGSRPSVMSPDSLANFWTIIGSRLDKDLAKDTLTKRENLGYYAKQKKLEITMLDEPDLRDQMINKLMNRILFGISYSDLIPETKNDPKYANYYFPKWESELLHIRQTWAYVGLYSAQLNKETMSNERAKQWDHLTLNSSNTDKIKALPDVQKLALINGDYMVAPHAHNTFTIKAIARIKELIKLKNEHPAQYATNQLDYEAQLALISFIFNLDMKYVETN